MKRLILASAVSALFAAPATVLAQAKGPAAPTLDKVLEASGLSASGYIDAGYSYSNRDIENNFSTRLFDNQNNSFNLHQVGVTLAKQPSEGFGGLVNLTMGKDAQAIHSTSGATVDTSMFDVTQAYAQYAGGSVTVIGGKFATLHGTEVIASPGNANISRSILFGSVPFTHTGVRATWALSDTVSLIGGVNNGWDQLTDSNKAKTLELGATLAPIKPLSIALSVYAGKEPSGGGEDGMRTSFDGVASYTILDPLSVGLETLVVNQDNVGGSGGPKQKYTGVAGYVTYMFAPMYRGTVRLERLDDKDGLRFGNPTGKYSEVTVTGAYLPADSFELRAEVRLDRANYKAYTQTNGATSKTLTTAALQALYKF